jgi:hypothetical protein
MIKYLKEINVKKLLAGFLIIELVSALLVSCGKDTSKTPGPTGPDTTVVLDLSVVGNWEGLMPGISLINFDGAKIFVDISKTDSVFSLVTLDPAKDTTKNPAIKDTSLVLTGVWKLNMNKDSILLICDTGRIIDTTQNILAPREVRGLVIPMAIAISKNSSTGDIEWVVGFTELVPIGPMLGLDLSSYPSSLLEVLTVTLAKKKQ